MLVHCCSVEARAFKPAKNRSFEQRALALVRWKQVYETRSSNY
jgi:hypothetical protein